MIEVVKAVTSSAASDIIDMIISGLDNELPAVTTIYTPDTPSRPSRVLIVSKVPTNT